MTSQAWNGNYVFGQSWKVNVKGDRRHISDDLCLVLSCLARVHYSDVIMGTMAFQITSLTIVYSTVYSGADQTKRLSSASLDFVSPVNSSHKWAVTRKLFPFDDILMFQAVGGDCAITDALLLFGTVCAFRCFGFHTSWIQALGERYDL